jgi:hypothetical protein
VIVSFAIADSSSLAHVQVGVRSTQIADHHRVVRLTALDKLSRASAKVNNDLLVRDVDDPPMRAREHPALEVSDGQGLGAHRGSNLSGFVAASRRVSSSRPTALLAAERRPPPWLCPRAKNPSSMTAIAAVSDLGRPTPVTGDRRFAGFPHCSRNQVDQPPPIVIARRLR